MNDEILKLRLPSGLKLLRRLRFPKKLGILEFLYGRTLSQYGEQWVECWNGVTWKLDLGDACHRWIVYGKYEGGIGIDFARTRLNTGGIFIDSGANIGQWLLYIAQNSNVKTLAFEPVKSQRHWLSECIDMQNQWQVSVFDFGLSSTTSSMEIQCDGARSTVNLDWFKDKDLARETINVRRLDEHLESLGISEVTFWKLDVEGAELEALKGAHGLLKERQINTIFVECHPNNYAEVRKLLAVYDYHFFQLKGNKLVPMVEDTIKNTQDLIAIA